MVSTYSRKQIEKELGKKVDFPKVSGDIYYKKLGNRIELNIFEYPEILKDSSILEKRAYQNWVNNEKKTGIKKINFIKRPDLDININPITIMLGLLRNSLKRII